MIQMSSEQANQTVSIETQQEKLLVAISSAQTEQVPLFLSKRLLVSVLMFICFVNVAFIRCSISIAVVEMTSNKSIKAENTTVIQKAEFDWDSKTVGFVLSAFYYGGLVSLVSGFMVSRFGGAVSCALSLMLAGFTIVLHPACLHSGFHTFLACRVLTGIFESFMQASISEVSSKWMPQNEKSKLMSFAVNGNNVGAAIVHSFCGFLASEWGWSMIFYVVGAISMVTSIACFILVKNQPSEDKWISEKEVTYIHQRTTTATMKRIQHPYRRILLSAPVWALINIQFTLMWVWTILSTLLPLYVKGAAHSYMTQDNISKIGLISSIPNMANIFILPICGILLDYTKKFDISQTKIHKLSLSGAYIFGSILFVSMVLLSNFLVSLISFIMIQMLLSVVILILQILMISIAPNNTSAIAGLCTFVNAFSSIMARNTTGFMTMNHTLEEWNRCFLLASGITFFGAVIFVLYGSSEAQPWSKSSISDSEQTNHNNSNQLKI